MGFSDPSIVPTKYWHRLEDGRVQCDVCPRYCKLHEGQRGFCFVRACQDNQVVLTTYGRSSGYCIDPIEKKPLNHFLPGTPVLSFGTAGCNLGCKFCQNWDISKSREIDTLADSASPELIARRPPKLGCRSVAFTYNDPVIFMEYAIDVAQACRAVDIKSVAVTAGEICEEPRAEFYAHMDAANVDLKGFTEEFYHEVCRAAHLQPVLDRSCTSNTTHRSGSRSRRCSFPAQTIPTPKSTPRAKWIAEKSRAGGPAALHGLPPRFPHARQAAHAAGDPQTGPFDRPGQ